MATAIVAVVRVAKFVECIIAEGRQKASGQSGDCRLSSPGGGSDRNYDWRIDAAAPRIRREDGETDRERRGDLKLCGMSGRGRVARR